MTGPRPFWKTRRLDEMSAAEWESLCDGCGLCCLNKLEYEDTGAVEFTSAACRYLDAGTCRCADYENRKANVPDCVQLTPESVYDLYWLPETCAYRLVAAGDDLPWWHPLVSGDRETVHEAGISARGRVISEDRADDLQDHIIGWVRPGGPVRRPPRRRSGED